MKQLLFGQKIHRLTPCKVQISYLSFFYTSASSRSKKLVNSFQCFHSQHPETTLHARAKGIFSKFKSSHSIFLLKIPLQWLQTALMTYLRSLPRPTTRSHLIKITSNLFHPLLVFQFNSTVWLSLSPTK